MPNAENARLQVEAGQNLVPQTTLSDDGDHLTFTSGDSLWSDVAGSEAVVVPNGIRTGGVVSVGAGNDNAACSAATANLNGDASVVIAADITLAMTRPAANKVKKLSIIAEGGSGAWEVVAGADGDSFSTTRGVNGGPPLLDVDDVEAGQVWLDDDAAAPVKASEIHQVVGTHREVYNYPVWDVKLGKGQVVFAFALALDHTGPAAKRVYAEYSTPAFVNLQKVNNVKPPEETTNSASQPTFDGPVASSSKALGQGSFDIKLQDGVNDIVVQNKGKKLWFKFFPNKFKGDYILFQGVLAISRQFAAESPIASSCSVSPETVSADVPA